MQTNSIISLGSLAFTRETLKKTACMTSELPKRKLTLEATKYLIQMKRSYNLIGLVFSRITFPGIC